MTIGLDVSLDQTALLLIDINGIGSSIQPDPQTRAAWLYQRQAAVLETSVAQLLAWAREVGIRVIYLENHWRPGIWAASEFARFSERTESGHLGSFEEVYCTPMPASETPGGYAPCVTPRESDVVIQKTMFDGFFDTPLDSTLRSLCAETVICAGFDADICVQQTVIGAMYRSYVAIVVRDCVLGFETSVDAQADTPVTTTAVEAYEKLGMFTTTLAELQRSSPTRARGHELEEARDEK